MLPVFLVRTRPLFSSVTVYRRLRSSRARFAIGSCSTSLNVSAMGGLVTRIIGANSFGNQGRKKALFLLCTPVCHFSYETGARGPWVEVAWPRGDRRPASA